jgi:hypothetical protein
VQCIVANEARAAERSLWSRPSSSCVVAHVGVSGFALDGRISVVATGGENHDPLSRAFCNPELPYTKAPQCGAFALSSFGLTAQPFPSVGSSTKSAG